MKLVHEVLELLQKQQTKVEKVNVLKSNETWALKDILRGSIDSTVEWALPAGSPPYVANRPESTPSNLLKQNVKFKYFVKGVQYVNMKQVKREKLFIEVLESIHPKDAELVVNMVSKPEAKGGWYDLGSCKITRPMINEAFPDLLQDNNKE